MNPITNFIVASAITLGICTVLVAAVHLFIRVVKIVFKEST